MKKKTSLVENNNLGVEKLENITGDNLINLVFRTIKRDKQVIIFNNSKRSSEATAEKIANEIKKQNTNSNILSSEKQLKQLKELSEKILNALSVPTKQCKRLAKCVEAGCAFHHSGLTSKQRILIEESFKLGLIKVISSTPTLAAGLNLPAYKVIIKDYKRYSQRGMADIPVLEYHQMAGRAGRPGYEDIGRSVIIVKDEKELNRIKEKYVFGEPEEILSKLAVEPILKMYTLALISTDIINTISEAEKFFKNTLYAKQFGDIQELMYKVVKIINILKSYDFVDENDGYFIATRLGKRISELYLNPDTAHDIIENLDTFAREFKKEYVTKTDVYSLINFVCNTVEMKPLFRIRKSEEDIYVSKLENADDLIIKYDPFEIDYEEFLSALKTTDVLQDWIEEKSEDYISEKYNVTPGELKYKVDSIDWLLYSIEQLSGLKKEIFLKNYITKLRIRFKYGIKQELLPLIKISGIGRIRARVLFEKGYNSIAILKKTSVETLQKLVGPKTAIKIKEQIDDINYESRENKNLIGKPKEIKYRTISTPTESEVNNILLDYEKSRDEEETVKEKQKYGFTLNDFM